VAARRGQYHPGVPTPSPGEALALARHRALLELAALDKRDFTAVLRHVLRTDADLLDIARVNCWCFETEPRAIRCVEGYVRAQERFERGTVLSERDYPHYFRALAADPIILADDARQDGRTAEFRDRYLDPHDITSMMDVPIWVGGALWGVVCHEHVGPRREWTASERDFALSIGHIISMAIEARDRLAAERTTRSSELFVGVLGHDLRTPLSTIRASAELLLDGASEAQAKVVQRLTRSADQMTRMIDQLLDFTRIRLGSGLPVARTATDLAELCGRVAADAGDRGRVVAEARGDCAGQWDPDRLWQLVSNLVGNALTHGRADEPIAVRVDGSAADQVVLAVENRGAIAPARLAILFDPFRAHESRAPGDRGLGLGLYIAREIATVHGGTLEVASAADRTTVTVRLPRGG
jgi:signal transduction histidine kinase